MIKWMACLGQQLVPGLDILDQRNLLPRDPQQRFKEHGCPHVLFW